MSPLPQQGERISPSTSQARLYLRRIYDYGAGPPEVVKQELGQEPESRTLQQNAQNR
jgi:hypothetical protein